MTDEAIAQALRQTAEANAGQVACSTAFQIARRLGAVPAQVGAVAVATGVRVYHCQLGLFGYGPKAEGKSKIVRPLESVPPALAARLNAAVDERGELTCAAVWEVARQARLGRLAVADAAEGLGLRVAVCQLGCFKPRH